MQTRPDNDAGHPILRTVAIGFLSIALMWAAWFLTSLPALGLPPPVVGAAVLGTLVIGVAVGLSIVGGGIARAALGGLVASIVNLLLLGSFLTDAPSGSEVPTAELDPTLMLNDIYRLRITALDQDREALTETLADFREFLHREE